MAQYWNVAALSRREKLNNKYNKLSRLFSEFTTVPTQLELLLTRPHIHEKTNQSKVLGMSSLGLLLGFSIDLNLILC